MNVTDLEEKLIALENRLTVLDERVQYRAAEQAKDYMTISKLVDQAVDLRVNVRVLETRLAVYSALGSFIGGGAISLLVNILFDMVKR